MLNRTLHKRAFALVLLAMATGLEAAQAVTPLTMIYYERKPFHYTMPNGKVTGLTVEPTERAFAKLGIPIIWELVSSNRVLLMLKRNDAPVCSPGWYKNSEREEYARFSAPIYTDQPLVGLSRSDFKVKQGITAKELFEQPQTQLLLKTNFTQGAYMDALIAKMPAGQIQSVSTDVDNMVKMIHAKRADLVIATSEEVELYVASAGYPMNTFKVLRFPDVPAVEKRYLVCSQQVTEQVMSDFNKAIASRTK